MPGRSWERDGHLWFAVITLTRCMEALPLMTAKDLSLSLLFLLIVAYFLPQGVENSRFWLRSHAHK